jgi:Ca2+/Na+ antiporter
MTHLETIGSFFALTVAIFMAFFANYFPSVTPWIFLILLLIFLVIYFRYRDDVKEWLQDNFILQYSADTNRNPFRQEHDRRRFMTYPPMIPNTWYHLCDVDELTPGRVMEVRALNKVFVLWRSFDGTVVCQDAFCTHQGANLGVLGNFLFN